MNPIRFLFPVFALFLVFSTGVQAGFWALDVELDRGKVRAVVVDIIDQRMRQPILIPEDAQVEGRSVFPLKLLDTPPLSNLQNVLQGLSIQRDGTVLLAPEFRQGETLIRTIGRIEFTGGATLGQGMEQIDLTALIPTLGRPGDPRYKTLLRPIELHVDLTPVGIRAPYTTGQALGNFVERKGLGESNATDKNGLQGPALTEYPYPHGEVKNTSGQGVYGELAAELTVLSFPGSFQLESKYNGRRDNGVDGLFWLDSAEGEIVVSESKNEDPGDKPKTLFKKEIENTLWDKIDRAPPRNSSFENYALLRLWFTDKIKRAYVFFVPYRFRPGGKGQSLCYYSQSLCHKVPDEMRPVAVVPAVEVGEAPAVLPNVGGSGVNVSLPDSPEARRVAERSSALSDRKKLKLAQRIAALLTEVENELSEGEEEEGA